MRGGTMPTTNQFNLADLGQDFPQFLTLEETSKLLRVTYVTAWRWVQNGTLPSLRVGRRRLVPAKALLEALTIPPRPRRGGRR